MRLPIAEVIAWRDSAIADGWSCEPIYQSEPADHCARLTREGFVVSVYARPTLHGGAVALNGEVIGWGPDGCCVNLPERYAWEPLRPALRVCDNCGAADIDPCRYSFAGRCCAACLPKMRAEHEKPGWCD